MFLIFEQVIQNNLVCSKRTNQLESLLRIKLYGIVMNLGFIKVLRQEWLWSQIISVNCRTLCCYLSVTSLLLTVLAWIFIITESLCGDVCSVRYLCFDFLQKAWLWNWTIYMLHWGVMPYRTVTVIAYVNIIWW